MRVLIIENDVMLASFVRKGLEAEHYAVDDAADAEQGLALALMVHYDLVIAGHNLPRLDAVPLLTSLRQHKAALRVMVLSASGGVEERVKCLDAGADDYLLKPFSFLELAARVRALLRRSYLASDPVLIVLDLKLDRVERRVERGGRCIDLTTKEFALLEYLMRNAGRRLTRAMIIEHVWNLAFETTSNVVDVYINYLRRKVDDGFSPALIHTVRGVGYQLGAERVAA